jgi:hypothetical protein
MIRSPRQLVVILACVLGFAACTTNRSACKLSINKKKLNYYNSLQYRGAKKN